MTEAGKMGSEREGRGHPRRCRKALQVWLLLGALTAFAACDSDPTSMPAPVEASPSAEAVPEEDAADLAGAVPPEPELERQSSEIRSGEPLDLALRRLDLADEERMATVGALKDVVDFRRILPGEVVEVARTGAGELREVELQRAPFERVVVRFGEGITPLAEVVRRVPDVSLRRIEGELDGSLYEAVLAAGGDANLTMRYADLLEWQVDFLTEPRPGDRFRILVREESLDDERLGFGKILAAEYQGARASARAIRYVDSEGTLDWYDDEAKSVRRAFLKSPLSFRRISSRFSAHRLHPILKTVRPHWGVDYAAPTGTPVSALGSGTVVFAGRKGGYGNYLEIRHSSTYTTCYGHLSKFAKGVRKGTRVDQGDVVGFVGSTGLSTGPHLDFRVKQNGGYVDPLKLDSPPGRALAGAEAKRFSSYLGRVWQLAEQLPAGQATPEEVAWAMLAPRATAEEVMAWSPPALATAPPAEDGDVPASR